MSLHKLSTTKKCEGLTIAEISIQTYISGLTEARVAMKHIVSLVPITVLRSQVARGSLRRPPGIWYASRGLSSGSLGPTISGPEQPNARTTPWLRQVRYLSLRCPA